MGFLSGKRILVTGVASKLSIAYGIAQAMHREGAELAFTYQNDKLKGRVEEFAAQLGSDIVLQCDVAEDASIDTMFAELGKVWPKIDGFVHGIGFAPGDQLDGDYVNAVTREGFKIAHDISSYSFVAMAKACRSRRIRVPPWRPFPTLALSALSRTTTLWVWQKRLWKPTCAIW